MHGGRESLETQDREAPVSLDSAGCPYLTLGADSGGAPRPEAGFPLPLCCGLLLFPLRWTRPQRALPDGLGPQAWRLPLCRTPQPQTEDGRDAQLQGILTGCLASRQALNYSGEPMPSTSQCLPSGQSPRQLTRNSRMRAELGALPGGSAAEHKLGRGRQKQSKGAYYTVPATCPFVIANTHLRPLIKGIIIYNFYKKSSVFCQ